MATQVDELAIGIVAKLDQFERDMGQLPGIGAKEAKLMAAEINKSLKAAEKAAKEATKASKDSAKGMKDAADAAKNMGEKAGFAGESGAKLAGILDRIAPGAGEVARFLNDVADAGEVAAKGSEELGLSLATATASVGVAAIAVAGIVYAYSSARDAANAWTNQINENNAAIDRAIELAEKANKLADITRDLAVETGSLSKADAAEARAREAVQTGYEETVRTANQVVGSLKQQVDQLNLVNKGTIEGSLQWENYQRRLGELNFQLGRAEANLGAVNLAEATSEELAGRVARKREEETQATKDKATADRLAADAARAEAEALRIREIAARHGADVDVKLAAIVTEAQRDFRDDASAATAEALTGEEKVRAQLRLTIAAIDEKAQHAVNAALAMVAAGEIQATLEAEAQADRVAQTAKAEAEIAKIRADAATKAATAQAAAEKSAAQGVSASLASVERLFEVASAAESDHIAALEARLADTSEHRTRSEQLQLERRVRAEKAAAREAFRVQQGAAAITAAVNTALAISEANASAPYPANVPAIIAAGTTGIAEEVAIASQTLSFGDTPGPMQMQQGGTVRLARDDFFAAAQTPEDLRNQVGGGATSVEVSLRYRHQTFDRFMLDNLKRGGPLPRAIRGTSRVGHRSDR